MRNSKAYIKRKYEISSDILKVYLSLKGNWGQNFTPVVDAYFCEIYRDRTFYKVLWRFEHLSQSFGVTKFRKIRCKWRHPCGYNLLCSAVLNILEQKLGWFESLKNTFCFFLVSFSVFLCPLRSLYILETLIYDEQKSKSVRWFTAVTQLERLLAKYYIFNSLIQKLRGRKEKYGSTILLMGIT